MSTITASRRLTCPRCGAGFDCTLSDSCWCAHQPIGLPVPEKSDGEDCLCPDCFKAAAEGRRGGASG
jgi:uncharacterized protein